MEREYFPNPDRLPVGTEDYYRAAIEAEYYGVEDHTWFAFREARVLDEVA